MKRKLLSAVAIACAFLSPSAFAQDDLSSVGADIESQAHGALANRKAEAARDAEARRELAEQQAAAAQAAAQAAQQAQQAQQDAMERQQIMGSLMNGLQNFLPAGSPASQSLSQSLSVAAPVIGLPAPVAPVMPVLAPPPVYSLGPAPVANQVRIGVPAQKN